MATIDPVLGISLNDEPILEQPPSIILYGPSGSGKSTEAAKAFQNLLWLTSNPATLRPYASFLRDAAKPDAPAAMKAEAAGMTMPKRKFIPAYEPNGKTKIDNRVTLRDIIHRYCEAVQDGTCPYSGLVLDEYSEFANRVYDAINADSAYGRNAFSKIRALKEWNSWICSIPRITKQVLILICHEAEPKYDMEESSKTFGQLKYKGGPMLPIGTEIHSMSAEADIVLRIKLVKPMGGQLVRKYVTEVDPLYVGKFRDFGVKPEEDLGLRALCAKAGYKV